MFLCSELLAIKHMKLNTPSIYIKQRFSFSAFMLIILHTVGPMQLMITLICCFLFKVTHLLLLFYLSPEAKLLENLLSLNFAWLCDHSA